MSNRPQIWVTQTYPRALDSAQDFKNTGLKPLIYPVLEIAVTPAIITPPDSDTLLIFTARNGVQAFAEKHPEYESQNDVICVGDATAEFARSKGFQNVISAGGDARNVIALIKKTVSPSRVIRHCAGRHRRGHIVETLTEAGYKFASTVEYYASSPVTAFPANATLSVADLNYVAVYSPLGAETVAHLLANEETRGLTFLSISAATNAALGAMPARARLIATDPSQDGMISTLKLDLAQPKGQV